jgi:glycosyltransferase involved in cell wall biosynthesis
LSRILGKKPAIVAIIRGCAEYIDSKSYNSQEMGLARALAEQGCLVHIFSSALPTCQGRTINIAPGIALHEVSVIELPGRQGFFRGNWAAALFAVRPDIIQVHEYNQLMSILVTRWARRMRIPVILCQGVYRDYRGIISRSCQVINDKPLRWLLSKGIHACIAKTGAAEDYLHQKGFENIYKCPVGLNASSLTAPSKEDSQEYLSQLGIPPDSSILLYVGVLEQRRNIHLLLDIVISIRRNGEKVALIIVGDGPLAPSIRKRVQTEQIQDIVHLLGKLPQNQVTSLYREADVFLLASSYEIYGMVLLEAGYFGLPVVSSDTAGAREIIAHNESGIILNSLSLNRWVEAVNTLLKNHEMRAEMGKAASKRIRSHFLWDKAVVKYLSVYESVFNRRTP